MKSQILAQFGLIPPHCIFIYSKASTAQKQQWSPNAKTQTNASQQRFSSQAFWSGFCCPQCPVWKLPWASPIMVTKTKIFQGGVPQWTLPFLRSLALSPYLPGQPCPSLFPPHREGRSHGSPDPLGWFLQRHHHTLWGSLLGKLQRRQGLARAKRIKVPKRRGELW